MKTKDPAYEEYNFVYISFRETKSDAAVTSITTADREQIMSWFLK